MALVIPPGYAHVIHSMTLVGDPEPMAVTYAVELSTAGEADPQGTVLALHDNFGSQIMDMVANVYTLNQTEMRWVQTGGTEVLTALQVSNWPGLSAGNALPQNSAFLLLKRSALLGRRFRGRMYVPGVDEINVDAKGAFVTSVYGTLNTIVGGFFVGLNALAGVEFMVILLSTSLLSPTPAPTQVTSLYLDKVIATQRTRLRR